MIKHAWIVISIPIISSLFPLVNIDAAPTVIQTASAVLDKQCSNQTRSSTPLKISPESSCVGINMRVINHPTSTGNITYTLFRKSLDDRKNQPTPLLHDEIEPNKVFTKFIPYRELLEDLTVTNLLYIEIGRTNCNDCTGKTEMFSVDL